MKTFSVKKYPFCIKTLTYDGGIGRINDTHVLYMDLTHPYTVLLIAAFSYNQGVKTQIKQMMIHLVNGYYTIYKNYSKQVMKTK